MKIGIDFDGTVADTSTAKSSYIESHFGLDVPPCRCNRTECVPLIGEAAYEEMGRVMYSRERTLQIPPVPGSVPAIRELAERASLFVVTARASSQRSIVEDWLHRNELDDCFKDIFGAEPGRDKVSTCELHSIDILIDDDTRHLREVNQLPRRILFQSDGSRTMSDDTYQVASSWADLISVIGLPDNIYKALPRQ